MLDKYKYKNIIRYHFKEKKDMILSWENEGKSLQNLKWSGSLLQKKRNINTLVYKSACKRYLYYKNYKNLLNLKKDWLYGSSFSNRKQNFVSKDLNRKEFWNSVVDCLNNQGNLFFIKNNFYNYIESSTNIFKIMNVLNFTWLFKVKVDYKAQDKLENFLFLTLKYLYKGFLNNGNLIKCENKFLNLSYLLKKNLKDKSGFQILMFYIFKLKPLLGFRRKRMGRLNAKKKDIRYFYRLYNHNLRWQSLLVRNFIFKSPFYLKKNEKVSLLDIKSGLLSSLYNKGPIVKGLMGYYKLIGKRTPFAKRKKKKKRKRRNS